MLLRDRCVLVVKAAARAGRKPVVSCGRMFLRSRLSGKIAEKLLGGTASGLKDAKLHKDREMER